MSIEPLFEKVTLVGLGLMGSSLGHAMKRDGIARHIAGCARSQETLKMALKLGFVDSVHENLEEGVDGADLVILCTPVGLSGSLCEQMAPSLKQGAILTDVGSVKGAIIAACQPHIPKGVHFVPGHPMAGTEYSGPASGFAGLFDGKWCMLTPLADGDQAATQKMISFWERCGANVDVMTPEHHDLVAAITSHLPHLIAYNIVGTVDDIEEIAEREVLKYAAGGFRDFTRIAASDPLMWRDIFLNNREIILDVLGRFNEDLSRLARAIRDEDADKLLAHFTRTRKIRQNLLDEEKDKYPNFLCRFRFARLSRPKRSQS